MNNKGAWTRTWDLKTASFN